MPPAQGGAREEDSGLHDIRSLASSQRMRNSTKRITVSPPVDDTILAASSAGWKAVALPVAEPVRDEAPVDNKRTTRSSKQMASATPIGAHAAKKQKSKAPIYAVASLGLAAAAGAAIYIGTKDGSSPEQHATTIAASSSGSTAPTAKVTPLPGATATPIEPAPAAPPPAEVAAAAPTPPATPPSDGLVAQADPETAKAADRAPKAADDDATKSSRAKSKRREREVVAEKTESRKPEISADKRSLGGAAVVKPTGKGDKGDKGDKGEKTDKDEPSFEELLKEANIPETDKKPDKPKLEKKSLSSADIKKGMSGVAAKAQGCYNGTQGTASVKLVVDPSGKVSKVTVSGAFAGTPVGACVEKAVKGATFPAWDGGPQSFGYSYLLSE